MDSSALLIIGAAGLEYCLVDIILASMKHTSKSEKIRKTYDKMMEASSLTGIVLSHMLMRVLPESAKEKMERTQRNADDRRRDRRFHVDRTIACTQDGKELSKAHLINISKGGMYLKVDAPFDVGQEMSFNLSSKTPRPLMWVKGRVMRRVDRGMAIRFTL